MSLLKNIVQGYTNWIFENPEIEKIATERLAICQVCPERSDQQNSLVSTFSVCTKCGCTLNAKTRAPQAQCPLLKWKSNVTSVTDNNESL